MIKFFFNFLRKYLKLKTLNTIFVAVNVAVKIVSEI